MNLQQSFHPIISNTTLYERMFRTKPYTKCLDCLYGDKIKCKKCMERIILDISKNEQPKKLVPIRQISTSNFSATKYTHYQNIKQQEMKKSSSMSRYRGRKQNQEKIMIKSKYNWWLEERVRRKQADSDMKDNWPRKTRLNDINLQHLGAKQPKFQRWQKKLLDKLLPKNNSFR